MQIKAGHGIHNLRRIRSLMERRGTGVGLLPIISLTIAAALMTAAPAEATRFDFNTGGAITINDNAAATPYPSTISVAGVTGTVYKVVVRINGLSHTFPNDIDILLQSSAGIAIMLLSDSGGGTDAVNANLTFDDCAPRSFLNSSNTPVVTGRYRPTNNQTGDNLPSPAPQGSTATSLAAFNGTSVNGTWSLYVADDLGGDSGSIASWGLTIYTDADGLPAGINPIPCGKPDFDGDGLADVAVYRANTGAWFILRSSDGGQTAVGWGGAPQDIPVAADYDGDGITDIAIYRNGAWFIRRSSDGVQTTVSWGGAADDTPVPADYDGDGEADVAVYRASTGAWFILRSSDGAQTTIGWGGSAADVPIN